MTNIPSEMREILHDEEKFKVILAWAIQRSLEEEFEGFKDQAEWLYQLYEAVIENVFEKNVDLVFTNSESPIEIIMLNSLISCFVRNLAPIVIMPRDNDIVASVEKFRDLHGKCGEFFNWYLE